MMRCAMISLSRDADATLDDFVIAAPPMLAAGHSVGTRYDSQRLYRARISRHDAADGFVALPPGCRNADVALSQSLR